MQRITVALTAAMLAGCSGLLIVEQQEEVDICLSSGVCGIGLVCVDGTCVDSPGRCSLTQTDGDCPLGRICSEGVCVGDPTSPLDPTDPTDPDNPDEPGLVPDPDPFRCSECPDDQLCAVDECVDPSDATKACSSLVVDGACPEGDVCVAGACIEIVAGRNECAEERPDGLCPIGAFCSGGFCLPVAERACSPELPDGACPAGLSCIAGTCQIIECSDDALFSGQCRSPLVCLNGNCELPAALRSCAELEAVSTCASQSREACSTGPDGIDRCGECLSGFVETELGTCDSVACGDLDCVSQNRVCDSSAVPVACGACADGYTEIGGECVAVTACADRGCDALNRNCVDGSGDTPAQCTDCVDTFSEVADQCQPDTCLDLDCGSLNRTCIPESGDLGAQCGDCLDGRPASTGCRECDVTAECATGWCNNGVCAVDCTDVSQCGDDPGTAADNYVCTVNNRCAQIRPGPNGVCGAGFVEGEVVEPLVGILVDQSGSMRARFETELPDGTAGCEDTNGDNCLIARWYALEAILFGDTEGLNTQPEGLIRVGTRMNNRDVQPDPDARGLITRFQDRIQFALAFYTDDSFDGPLVVRYPQAGGGITTDPTLAVEPRLNTEPDLDGPNSYRTELAEFYAEQTWAAATPTGEAIFELDAYLRDVRARRVAAGGPANPIYIVLATDGAPDHGACEPDTVIGEYRALEATQNARREQVVALNAGGSRTLPGATILPISIGDPQAINHLQDVANVGSGAPSMLTRRNPSLTDIGTFPGPVAADPPTTDRAVITYSGNPYFTAYVEPSELHEGTGDPFCVEGALQAYPVALQSGSCALTSDCAAGERCLATVCVGQCAADSDCEGDALCIDGRCANYPLQNPSGFRFLNCDIDPNPVNITDTSLNSCRSVGWPDQSDYEKFFADLSSNQACDGDNPCVQENEICCAVDSGIADCDGFDNQCRVAACTPGGTFEPDGAVGMAGCYIGNDGQSLGDSLAEIFNEVLSCTVELEVTQAVEALGTVFLDDDPLPADAWRVTSPSTIEIIDDPDSTTDFCDILKDGNPHFVNVEIDSCFLIGG